MFKFLKEKLGSWIKKSKETIEKKEEKEVIEEVKEEIQEKEQEKQQEIKKEKEEIKESQEEVKNTKASGDIPSEEVKEAKPEEKEKTDKIREAEKRLEEAKEKLDKKKKEFEEIEEEKTGFFSKLKEKFSYKLNKDGFDEIFEGLEMLLLENNVALEVVEKIKQDLEKEIVGKEIKKAEIEKKIKLGLKKALEEIIIEPENIIETIKSLKQESNSPFKILFFGINGAGKTTSIAKFAHLLKKNNLSCVLVASDTFRAASIEQLQIHADKLNVKMIRQDYGSDPSAVAFDAIKYAENNKIDVVLIDTAGRMHNKDNLLREMEKICRVTTPNLKVFVAEAIAGNDATEQARAFNKIAKIDGTLLSKTDIDEKGGTIISISYVTNKPILYIGTGQNYEDLKLFNKENFIKQLGLDE